MPVLELTAEMVGTRLALGYIESVMLWPNDAQQRAQAFETAHAAYTRDVIAQAATASMPMSLSYHDLLPVVSGLADALPLKALQNSVNLQFVRGFIAGEIFREALIDHESGRKIGLQNVKKEIISRFKYKKHFKAMLPATVENLIWRVFRPVAHLWAASIEIAAGQPRAFPCTLADLPSFLAISESFRLSGELRLRQSRATLLDPATTWVAPPGLPLPEIDTDWRRLGDQKCSKAE